MVNAPATPGGDPIGATTGEVGGPRHYEGPTLGTLASWKCPSCGQVNTTPFEDGCPQCGAGTARPRHVGVPPRADAMKRPIVIPASDARNGISLTSLDAMAFGEWMAPRRGTYAPEIEAVLYEAWQAAIRWYQSTLRTELGNPTTLDEPSAPSTTVPMPKALVERVLVILEATTDLPEDQQSPELVGVIAELKELLES